jgi:hypothetical protein
MTWYAWAMVVLLAFGQVASVLLIGKPRDPRTPGEALVSIVINGLFIWAIVAFKQAVSERAGGRCQAVGPDLDARSMGDGTVVFLDLEPGERCPVIDPSRLDGHHGSGDVPDLLLCNEHHAQLDLHARRRRP